MKNNRSIIITVGILVVLLIVVVALVMTRPATDSTPNENGNNQSELGSTGGDELNSVIVNDQIPGDVMFYSNLTLDEDGFVVVRKSDDAGNPGEIIGVQAVEAGTGISGNVELEESTVEGGEYFIELYVDSNDNGIFDEDEDEPVLTSSGNNVRLRVTTTEDLPEIKG